MNDDLISRKAAYDAFDICEGMLDPLEVRMRIEQLPTITASPERTGYWIDLGKENSTGPMFKCSQCSHIHNPNKSDLEMERVELKPLYCDACGAHMVEGEEHDNS